MNTVVDPRPTQDRSAAGKKDIEQLAMDVLIAAGIPIEAPIDLQTLARARGVRVYKATFADPGISGLLSLDAKYNPAGAEAGERGTIFVNNGDYPTRQAFTLAHEIGHLELKHYSNDVGFHTERLRYRAEGQPYNGREEREANQFAAALLMPIDIFKDAMFALEGEIASVAVLFGVSIQAATIRANNLGLLPNWCTEI